MDKHLKELLGQTGFGELDNAQFESKDEYDIYFAYIKKVLKAFSKNLNDQLNDQDQKKVENTVVSYYITRLLRSIEQLKTKYQFDHSHNIRVDTTDSSFPNHSELRQMKADHQLKNEFLNNLPNALVLKDKLISKLRTQLEEPLDILDALAKRKYYSSLFPASIYLMFNKGRLIKLESSIKQKKTKFIYAWASYHMAVNRPQIYVMELEYSSPEKALDKKNPDFIKFEEIIENVTEGSQNLYEMVSFIDQELPAIHPKLIKKYDIGPIYGEYSADKNLFTEFYKKHELDSSHFILVYEEHTIVSVGETSVKSRLQNFHIDNSDRECTKLKLSALKRHLIAPHNTIQELYSDAEMTEHLTPYRSNILAI